MKQLLTTLMVVALAASLVQSQTMDRSPAPSPESFPVMQNPNAQFDLQFDYDASAVTGAAGNAAAVFVNNEFWTSRWATNVLHRWSANGTLIEQFTVAGVTGVRGLAYDGQYLYGSSNTASIFKIDPVTKTLVSTITCQGGVTTRFIAYDPVRDGFWTGNFTGNISCVSRTGAVIATITNTLAAKYGAAYDGYTPGGPYLWIWDQTNTTGGIPQPIYQFNLTTLTATGVQFDILSRVTTGGATPIAGGLFVTTGLAPGKATIGGLLQGVPDRLWGLELATTAADTVLPFTLLNPTAGTTLTTLPGSATPVVISWDTNRTGVTFKWIFGAPAVPPRLITLPSGTNTITTTLGALDAVLAGAGVAQGDSLVGQWDVWAFRNNAPANDSLKSTNGPRAITLKRGRPALSAFSLVSPASGTTIVTNAFVTTPINFVWRSAGPGPTYRWKFATPTFPGTIRLNVLTALDTLATFRSSQLDSLIAALGVAPGDSIVGQWRAYGYSGTDSLASTQTFNLTLKRAVLPPCLSDYTVTRETGITFVSIATTGTSFASWRNGTTNIDDNRSAATPIGFTFSYLGLDYATFSASTSGLLDLSSSTATGSGTGAYGYQNTQFTAATGSLLGFAPLYDDLIFPTGTAQANIARYQVDGSAPNRVLTVEWVNVGFYNAGAVDGNLNFQVKLYETTSKIEFVYGPMTAPTVVAPTYTLGLSGATMSVPPTFCELKTQQTANSATFSNTPQNALATTPEANSKLTFTLTSTSVEPVGSTTPTEFALAQNYPNPFNPTTTIQYALSEQSTVTLKVFNILGQEVATLVNGVQSASHYNAVWDGRNSIGQPVSTGIYFYRLEAKSASGKDFGSMKKMLLIK